MYKTRTTLTGACSVLYHLQSKQFCAQVNQFLWRSLAQNPRTRDYPHTALGYNSRNTHWNCTFYTSYRKTFKVTFGGRPLLLFTHLEIISVHSSYFWNEWLRTFKLNTAVTMGHLKIWFYLTVNGKPCGGKKYPVGCILWRYGGVNQ